MAEFQPTPTIIRQTDRFALAQVGASIEATGDNVRGAGNPIMIADIEANSTHFLRPQLVAFKRAGAVAVVLINVAGKNGWATITADQWAIGADERARYAAWDAPRRAERQKRVAAERKFDRGYNEGGEGYNPYRHGSAPTYR
ncbi:MAG: hypothetical protein DI530_17680 [Sphingomonas sp.]|jgi:hypothetical protein|uniref:hypothetical protein n=1 Tax=unclassified Sphingomonas TaxID=196159 RepID=UPI00082C1E0A|nr:MULTISPECIES: hypothetical protein [unclassified Sphingomonas]PZU73094.1 MAG: hypothetical protein DI530_17680 [Sphingomonas sp.]